MDACRDLWRLGVAWLACGIVRSQRHVEREQAVSFNHASLTDPPMVRSLPRARTPRGRFTAATRRRPTLTRGRRKSSER